MIPMRTLPFENYHKHTYDSNIYTADSAVSIEDYAKRAVELGHKTLSSVEHGYTGRYFETFKIAKKYGLKFIYGAEAYWVKNRHEKNRTNAHICILAKTNKGRKALNLALSEANDTGYYYKPRLDMELILGLPKDDVLVTTACVGFWMKDRDTVNDEIEEHIMEMYNHFGDNFMLEIQYQPFNLQLEINKRILEYHKEYGINIIAGMDSHYIYDEQRQDREEVLLSKNIKYDNEDEFYMDYPDYNTAFNRFKDQGIFTDEEIHLALANTNIINTFEDLSDIDIFSDRIKLPTLYPELTQDEKDAKLYEIMIKAWNEYKKDLSPEEIPIYEEQIEKEFNIIKDTGMSDYFLIDYEIVKDAVANGGMITPSGRGCFTEDSLVHTDSGMKSIKDVKIGDKVITKDGKFNKVLNTMKYDINEELIKIKHLYGTDKYNPAICTTDHEILINNGYENRWKHAKDIKKGEFVCVPKVKFEDAKVEFIDLNKYNVFNYEYDDDYIYEYSPYMNNEYEYSPCSLSKLIGVGKGSFEMFANGDKKVMRKRNQFAIDKFFEITPFKTQEEYVEYIKNKRTKKIKRFIENDKTLNIFIGLMYGDGFTNTTKDTCFGLAINNTTEKDKINRGIFEQIAKRLNLKTYENRSKTKKLSQLSINSKIVTNYIKTELFESEKGKIKEFNSKLFNQNVDNLKGIEYGLFLSDGSDKDGSRVCFDNTSPSIINAYKLIGLATGSGINSLLIREGYKTKEGYTCKKSYKLRRSSTQKERIKEDDEFWYLPVKDIVKISKTKTSVYDITVENESNYLLNNMIVHNSAVSMFINTLFGFSKVDRISADVTMLPER